jgi:putative nucleotidyltransferase with HDIG domain
VQRRNLRWFRCHRTGKQALTNLQRRQRLPFYLFYSLTVVGGFLFLFWLFHAHAPEEISWWRAGVFLIFLLLADTILAESQVGGSRVLSSKSIDLTVIALFGPAVAAGIEMVSTLGRGLLLRRMPPRKSLFNASMLALSAGAGGLVYHALPWHDRFNGPQFLVPLLAAIVTYSLFNQLLLTLIMSLDSRVPAPEVYRHSFSWVHLRSLIDAPFAAMVILLYRQADIWALLLYLFPVWVLYKNDKLFQQMKEAHISSIAALTTALEADEEYTHGHSYRVSKYAVKIGRAMRLPLRDLEILEYGGLLHDIGKIAITNDIVCKPGLLTQDEFAELQKHPVIGADIVQQIKFLRDVTEYVRHHHERPDGKGYPDGLKDGQISMGSHILNVCDAFDAMTSDRPYRRALSVERAIEELVKYRGTQFHAPVVDAVLQLYHRGEFGVITDTDGMTLEILRTSRSGN